MFNPSYQHCRCHCCGRGCSRHCTQRPMVSFYPETGAMGFPCVHLPCTFIYNQHPCWMLQLTSAFTRMHAWNMSLSWAKLWILDPVMPFVWRALQQYQQPCMQLGKGAHVLSRFCSVPTYVTFHAYLTKTSCEASATSCLCSGPQVQAGCIRLQC